MRDWEAVIGLEVHAQLKTQAKLFSSAPNAFGGEPNTQTTEVDLGMPGTLPVINRHAVELALRAAIALDCKIQPVSRFSRKHYFYPDLPKGYQISQYDEPYALGGAVPAQLDGEEVQIPLTRIHREEDAAKSIHDSAVTGEGVTHVNLNRAGVPLIEIVSEPAMRTPEEAGAYLRGLRAVLRYVDASDADMEKGNFRCDANVSVRPEGETELGVKVEVKNVNSFRSVEKAIAFEIDRQVSVLEGGGKLRQETRHWDDARERTTPSRSKEDADDYRYFPEPDLAPLQISSDWVESVRADQPELPQQRRQRFVSELGISADDARILAEDRQLADLFEQTAERHGGARASASFILRNVLRLLGNLGQALVEIKITAHGLAELLGLVRDGKLTLANANPVLAEMARNGGSPAKIVADLGLEAVSDSGEIEDLAREVITGNPDQLAQYRAVEKKVLNFFIGQVMKRTQGKADPGGVREALVRILDAAGE